MVDALKNTLIGIALAVLAYLRPLEGELMSLFLIFFANFTAGYLSGMIANKEEFELKKAARCVGEATVFFVFCTSIYAIGKFKHEEAGALQCVSFVTYVIIYFYTTNILKNLIKMFKEGTTPWMIFSFLYFVFRFKFVEKIPYLKSYLNINENEKSIKKAAGPHPAK
ncbi:MAG: hypothetical protein LKE54_03765 [Prevotella sp.]|jgi:hypothetical protein|nr:hypothetical protein [Prevotella sp.]MCH3994164.1 hypothetical protein [Prevotella sp.]